ncbi:L-aminopeptidase/D-esterase [Pilibacter termitis]|uniref:L-aminopeptidase/D-esterase n=1 Tax=Pilibacter termitis TaxID=263852 RepID=A0A1T4Q4W1_9ENTE|nr:P1 family peptidase [Pilibacter termitis]SJZ98258.1 L-aminopeptidase/D-esterase [Pilibacter termitis]
MKNNILDIKGIKVGHCENKQARTGVSVILVENGAVCGVDVRGSAPGTRETDLLNPINTIEKVHALVLSGGSAFGLASATGVMNYLEEREIGFDVGVTKVPIVPAAVLFDLANGEAHIRPDEKMGYQACENASDTHLPEGDVGAGCGARVGKILGMQNSCNSGIASFAKTTESGITVAAIVAVNAFGDVLKDGEIIAGAKDEQGNFANSAKVLQGMFSQPKFSGQNTTIGLIATNVALTKSQATKVASMAHDGLARSISPVHTTLDGDTLFCLSTCEKELENAPVDLIGIMACEVLEKAVVRAVEVCE